MLFGNFVRIFAQQLNYMNVINKNKRVYFEYSILDKYTAGIQLMGTEVKSIKESKASITEAFCTIIDGEIFIIGMHISDYKKIKHTNHAPLRNRKLLLNRKEIDKLSKATKEKGLTIVPLSVFISDTGLIKLEIGLAKGKKTYDKRVAIRIKTINKELKNELN